MIEGYLLDREPLEMVFVLVDGEIGPTPLDVQMLDWLRDNERAAHRGRDQDSTRSSRRSVRRRKRELAEGCRLEPGDIVWVSASKGAGLDQLRAFVRAPTSIGAPELRRSPGSTSLTWPSATPVRQRHGREISDENRRRRSRRCREGSSRAG